MTSIDDFKIAPFDKKCEWIVMGTIYLASKEDNDIKMYLYKARQYFIEVIYSLRSKRVLTIKAFNDSKELEPYLENISLEELMD